MTKKFSDPGLYEVEQAQVNLDAAEQRLAKAINLRWPVGRRVMVVHNKAGSYWAGVVSAETRGEDVIVKHDRSGKVHHKHWKCISDLGSCCGE